MLSSTTRTETDYTGILVKDKVCFDSDTCVNDYEFFVATTSSACNNLLGLGPSQDSSRPNLINALVNDKKVDGNKVTLYLNWDESGQKLDVGTSNKDLIHGDYSYHSTSFENDDASSPSFQLTNFTYNGTQYMTNTAPLIPFN